MELKQFLPKADPLRAVKNLIFKNSLIGKTIILVLLVIVFELFFPSHLIRAAYKVGDPGQNLVLRKQGNIVELRTGGEAVAPEYIPEKKIKRTTYVTVTAYTSRPQETDSTPYITASGSHVRDKVVAANFLPIGARVRFPDRFGDKEFIVEDRMNARYWHRMDIWMADLQEARQFGAQYLKVEILE